MAAPVARTAVILNANAKRVTEKRARQLQALAGGQDVFVSHSLEEAEQVVNHVVERGYQQVLAGGGDGTLVSVINSICQRAEEAGVEAPRFGVLRLGTGNAVASVLGAASPEQDLMALINGAQPAVVPMHLIRNEEDGRDFPFAGIGYDGEILNDYVWLKKNVKGPLVDDVAHSVLGYFAALFMRTLPRKLAEPTAPNVVVRSRGRAYFRDPLDGDAMREIAPGSVLYRGPAAMVSASTVPFYGYNFRMFPFAQDVPGMMQLRVVRMSPWRILNNLPAIWEGTHRDPDCLDFHVEQFEVEGDAPLPFQVGGDAMGHRTRLEFSVSPRRVEMLSLQKALPAAA